MVARWPGSTHDSFVFNNCALKQSLERGQYNFGRPYCHLIGDSGYALRPYLLTPVAHPADAHERQYNKALKGTRYLSETMEDGVLLSERHRGQTHIHTRKNCKVIMATAVLHNMRKFDGMIDDPVILDERPIDNAILDVGERAAAFRREFIRRMF